MEKEIPKILSFQDNCIGTVVNKFSRSRTGYFSLTVNMLPATVRFKISLREVYSKASSLRVMKNLMKVLS